MPRSAQHRGRDAELAAAAVDHQQVGQIVLLEPLARRRVQHLAHAREVVGADHGADAEAAIALRVGPALVERRPPRPTVSPPWKVEMSTHSTRFGGLRSCRRSCSSSRGLVRALLVVAPLEEGLARVRARQLDQPDLLAALRHQDRHHAPLRSRSSSARALGVVELDRQQDLVGDEALALIELRQQRAEHLLVGQLPVGEAEALVRGQLAAADHQHLRLDEAALAVDAEHVLIAAAVHQRPLPLAGLLDGAQLVAAARGVLEAQLARGRAHRGLRAACAAATSLPSRSRVTARSCPSYSSRSTGSTHGPRQRLIWYSRHGRVRFRNTGSLQVRSGNTLRTTSSVSRTRRRAEDTDRSSGCRRA